MNLLKERLNANQYVLGTMVSEVTTPNIARVLAAGGFEFLILDCEHGYFDFSQTAAIISAAAASNIPVVVRIPEIRREVITKYMDMGADGLLVPMVGSAEDVRTVVRHAKYAPMGQRGLSTQRAHTSYDPPPLPQHMETANRRTIILAQIETREAIRNLDEILAVEGVDAVVIGPNDLACDCGTPGDFATPEMKANVLAVVQAAKRAGKPSGIIASSIPYLKACREQGMTFFSCNSEVGMIIKGSKAIVQEMAE